MRPPLSEADLLDLERRHKAIAAGPVFVPSQIARLADEVPHLVAALRRSQAETFAATVEVDNLRKMLDDSNGREQVLLGQLDKLRRHHPELFPASPPEPMCRQVVGVDFGRDKDQTIRAEFDAKGRLVKIDPLGDIMPGPGEPPYEGRPT